MGLLQVPYYASPRTRFFELIPGVDAVAVYFRSTTLSQPALSENRRQHSHMLHCPLLLLRSWQNKIGLLMVMGTLTPPPRQNACKTADLYMPSDDAVLSDYQIFLRKQIEWLASNQCLKMLIISDWVTTDDGLVSFVIALQENTLLEYLPLMSPTPGVE